MPSFVLVNVVAVCDGGSFLTSVSSSLLSSLSLPLASSSSVIPFAEAVFILFALLSGGVSVVVGVGFEIGVGIEGVVGVDVIVLDVVGVGAGKGSGV